MGVIFSSFFSDEESHHPEGFEIVVCDELDRCRVDLLGSWVEAASVGSLVLLVFCDDIKGFREFEPAVVEVSLKCEHDSLADQFAGGFRMDRDGCVSCSLVC